MEIVVSKSKKPEKKNDAVIDGTIKCKAKWKS